MNATDTATPETAEQRHARRRADPDSHTVAVEQAAQAFATCQGWDWPSLGDFATDELRKIEQRQKIRYVARIMVDEYDRSLVHGNDDREALQRIVKAIQEQREDDKTRRLQLKPKPISSILAPRTGD